MSKTKEEVMKEAYESYVEAPLWDKLLKEYSSGWVPMALDIYAAQEKKELLDEIKELRGFFRKGSPLTEMLDKIIKKHSA